MVVDGWSKLLASGIEDTRGIMIGRSEIRGCDVDASSRAQDVPVLQLVFVCSPVLNGERANGRTNCGTF